MYHLICTGPLGTDQFGLIINTKKLIKFADMLICIKKLLLTKEETAVFEFSLFFTRKHL